MSSLNNVGRALQARRKSLGIETKDINLYTGMEAQEYRNIERGSDVSLSSLLQILEGLELDLVITPKHDVRLKPKQEKLNNGSLFYQLEQLQNQRGARRGLSNKALDLEPSYSNHDGMTSHFNGDTLDFWFGQEQNDQPEAEQ